MLSNDSCRSLDPERLRENNKISRLYLNEVKISDIANSLGISEATVKRRIKDIIPNHLRRNKGRTGDPLEPFNATIIKYYSNHHYSAKKISDFMKCSAEKIRYRLKKCGVQLRNNSSKNIILMHPKKLNRKKRKKYDIKDGDEFCKRFMLLFSLNYEKGEISKILGLHIESVVRRIDYLKSIYNIKLRFCKHCDRLFRFISSENYKNSNVCPLCMGCLKGSPFNDISKEMIESMRKLEKRRKKQFI